MSKRIKPGSPKRAIAYIRVSTEDQKLGPEAQRKAIASWAASQGTEVVAWFEDLGISGAAGLEERPGLSDAITALRESGAGWLVVAKRCRVARSVLVGELVAAQVRLQGANIAAADGVANDPTDEGEMLRGMMAVMATYERALIRSRTRAALAAKKARGERTGTVPYGFTVAPDGRLVAEPGEQAVIARARALRAAGFYVRGVVRTLAAEGVRNRAGRPLGLAAVHKLLRGTTAA